MNFAKPCLILAGISTFATLPAFAQAPRGDFYTEMERTVQKSNNDMVTIPVSGDVDMDFAGAMIPHQQGTVDLAKLELQYGKDPAMRKIAQKIVESQPKDITELQKAAERLKTARAKAVVTTATKITSAPLITSDKKGKLAGKDASAGKAASMADTTSTATSLPKQKHKPAIQR